MRRKPLSMKKLYLYAADFINADIKENSLENGGDFFPDDFLEERDTLLRFLEYIWKNPK